MTRAARLIEALQMFRERRGAVTAADLGERLGVSRRTAYRDIEALIALGAPIEGAAGLGYVLSEGYFLPPLTLTPAEADAIALGLRFVMRRSDAALAEAAHSAKAKLEAIMDGDIARASAVNGLLVGPGERGYAALGVLRAAMAQECKLHFSYRAKNGVHSQRTVWPVALGFFDDCETLAAWCETRSDFRTFRLDRIDAPHVLPERLPLRRAVLFAQWRARQEAEETIET